jgi:hypothetical protein
VIDAESRTVLNSLSEHELQDAFKNGRHVGTAAYARKRPTSRVMMASRPKINSDQMAAAAPVPEIMDDSLHALIIIHVVPINGKAVIIELTSNIYLGRNS